MKQHPLTVIDLFCGCGGLSEGFLNHRAFRVLAHFDNNKQAIEVLRKNLVLRHHLTEQEAAIHFFLSLANATIPHKAIENPIGIMSTHYRKADQIIQPYQYGEEATKTTCLWLENLPLLVPTKIVGKGEITTFSSGKKMPSWYSDAVKLSPEERRRVRSKTFQGIANAMAKQWSNYILSQGGTHEFI